MANALKLKNVGNYWTIQYCRESDVCVYITYIAPFTVKITDRFQIPKKDEENRWKEIVGNPKSKV